MKRREFLKGAVAASAMAGLNQLAVGARGAEGGGGKQEHYELRAYRLKSGAGHDLLDGYLEKAAVPGLNRLGIKPIGVFTETEPKDGGAVWVLMPHASLESLATAGARLQADPAFQQAGEPYLKTPKTNAAFERIDSWLLLAFAGMPKLEQPAYSREKKARIFELRTYESYSEVKALKKVEMFNSGEIEVMREVGLGPIFYGQALLGRDLPHLTYMLSAENEEAHKKHWDAFGKHPVWNKLKNDPQYADTVSKITKWMLTPAAYSQI